MKAGIACKVFYRADGSIEKVVAPNGKDSILFAEAKKRYGEKAALNIWGLAYSDEFKRVRGDWTRPVQKIKRLKDAVKNLILPTYRGTNFDIESSEKTASYLTNRLNKKQKDSTVKYPFLQNEISGVDDILSLRGDLTNEERRAVANYISRYSYDAQDAVARWFVSGNIRFPEDSGKVQQAQELIEKNNANYKDYTSPMEAIYALAKPSWTRGAVNPDRIAQFTEKTTLAHGLTMYTVEDSAEGRMAARSVLNKQIGKNISPWAALEADTSGVLTEESQRYWDESKGPKKIVFRDGRVVGFYSGEWMSLNDAHSQENVIAETRLSAKECDMLGFDNGTFAEREINPETGDSVLTGNFFRMRADGVLEEYDANGEIKNTSGESINEIDFSEDTEMPSSSHIRFSISQKKADSLRAGLQTKLSPSKIDALVKGINNIEKQYGVKFGKAAYYWGLKGTIVLPEDTEKVIMAVKLSDSLGGFQKYDSPAAVLDDAAQKDLVAKEKESLINPDDISTLHKEETFADNKNGITTYLVDESEESRQNMRSIINSHFGENASPWCLLQGDENGELTEGAARYWDHYNALPKRVAFQNGKLVAFFATNDSGIPTWWDRYDEPFYEGIPITAGVSKWIKDLIQKKNPGANTNNIIGTRIYNEETQELSRQCYNIRRGNPNNGYYEEWYETGALHESYTMKDGNYDGTQKIYQENGILREELEWKDGKRNGISRSWWQNGQLISEALFQDDKLTGIEKSWFRNGGIAYVIDVENDLSISFYENGFVRLVREIIDGKHIYKTWYDNGIMSFKRREIGSDASGLISEEALKWTKDGTFSGKYLYYNSIQKNSVPLENVEESRQTKDETEHYREIARKLMDTENITDVDLSNKTDVARVRFSISSRRKTDMEKSLFNKLTNATEEEVSTIVNDIQKLGEDNAVKGKNNNPKLENAALFWVLQGQTMPSRDSEKITKAVALADKYKLDIKEKKSDGEYKYNNPDALLAQYERKARANTRINPDNVSTLHSDGKTHPFGIKVYTVDESEESRNNMRAIMDTHFGKTASPWCLLKKDNKTGKLTEDSLSHWNDYKMLPKKVAFKDGKLYAFMGTKIATPTWWDRLDNEYSAIPLGEMEISEEEAARIKENDPYANTKGIQKIGVYDDINGEEKAEYEEFYRKDKDRDESWYSNGKIKNISEHKGGRFTLNGEQKTFYENGQIRQSATFLNGAVNGVVEEWSATGVLLSSENFIDGRREGISQVWDGNGRLLTTKEYQDGRSIRSESYYADGSIKELTEVKRDMYEESSWDEKGRKQKTSRIIISDRKKEEKEWFPNGQIKSILKLDTFYSFKNGTYVEYDSKGNLVESGRWIENQYTKNPVVTEEFLASATKEDRDFEDAAGIRFSVSTAYNNRGLIVDAEMATRDMSETAKKIAFDTLTLTLSDEQQTIIKAANVSRRTGLVSALGDTEMAQKYQDYYELAITRRDMGASKGVKGRCMEGSRMIYRPNATPLNDSGLIGFTLTTKRMSGKKGNMIEDQKATAGIMENWLKEVYKGHPDESPEDIFITTHFAPSKKLSIATREVDVINGKGEKIGTEKQQYVVKDNNGNTVYETNVFAGAELIQNAVNSKMPIVVATLDEQADMLQRAGFIELSSFIVSPFNHQLVNKRLMVNRAVTARDVEVLVKFYELEMSRMSSKLEEELKQATDEKDKEELKKSIETLKKTQEAFKKEKHDIVPEKIDIDIRNSGTTTIQKNIARSRQESRDAMRKTSTLSEAKEMERSGKTAADISFLTGWEKNKNGEWTYSSLLGDLSEQYLDRKREQENKMKGEVSKAVKEAKEKIENELGKLSDNATEEEREQYNNEKNRIINDAKRGVKVKYGVLPETLEQYLMTGRKKISDIVKNNPLLDIYPGLGDLSFGTTATALSMDMAARDFIRQKNGLRVVDALENSMQSTEGMSVVDRESIEEAKRNHDNAKWLMENPVIDNEIKEQELKKRFGIEIKHYGNSGVLIQYAKEAKNGYLAASVLDGLRRGMTKMGEKANVEEERPFNVFYTDKNGNLKMRVYHGSPYNFDKFSTTKIGTGQGAQTYGWGLYTSDTWMIGDKYGISLSSKNNGSFYVYEIEIPADTMDNYLDVRGDVEDETLTKITEGIKKLFQKGGELDYESKEIKDNVDLLVNNLLKVKEDEKAHGTSTGESIYENLVSFFSNNTALRNELLSEKKWNIDKVNVHNMVEYNLVDKMAASLLLDKLGFVGLKHKTGHMAGKSSSVFYNYILFRDSYLNIKGIEHRDSERNIVNSSRRGPYIYSLNAFNFSQYNTDIAYFNEYGRLDGDYMIYNKMGQCISWQIYSDGKLVKDVINQVDKQIFVTGNKENGYYAEYDVNNGEKLYSGNFSDGHPIGEHFWYSKEGDLMKEESYSNKGIKEGLFWDRKSNTYSFYKKGKLAWTNLQKRYTGERDFTLYKDGRTFNLTENGLFSIVDNNGQKIDIRGNSVTIGEYTISKYDWDKKRIWFKKYDKDTVSEEKRTFESVDSEAFPSVIRHDEIADFYNEKGLFLFRSDDRDSKAKQYLYQEAVEKYPDLLPKRQLTNEDKFKNLKEQYESYLDAIKYKDRKYKDSIDEYKTQKEESESFIDNHLNPIQYSLFYGKENFANEQIVRTENGFERGNLNDGIYERFSKEGVLERRIITENGVVTSDIEFNNAGNLIYSKTNPNGSDVIVSESYQEISRKEIQPNGSYEELNVSTTNGEVVGYIKNNQITNEIRVSFLPTAILMTINDRAEYRATHVIWRGDEMSRQDKYKDGRINTVKWQNGLLKSEVLEFIDGPVREERTWYENGRLLDEVVSDNKVRTKKMWYENGKMISYDKVSTQYGYTHENLYWGEDGKLLTELIENPQGQSVSYWYKNGQPKEKIKYNATGDIIQNEEWHENGQLKSESIYNEKAEVLSRKEWSADGRMTLESLYKDDAEVSSKRWDDKTGIITYYSGIDENNIITEWYSTSNNEWVEQTGEYGGNDVERKTGTFDNLPEYIKEIYTSATEVRMFTKSEMSPIQDKSYSKQSEMTKEEIDGYEQLKNETKKPSKNIKDYGFGVMFDIANYNDYKEQIGDGLRIKSTVAASANISKGDLSAITEVAKWKSMRFSVVGKRNENSVNPQVEEAQQNVVRLQESVEETKDLLAVHNIYTDTLDKLLDLGGLPMPTIAIVKKDMGYSSFGAVSFVMYKNSINPEVNKDNYVYDRDAWTPKFPIVEYDLSESKVREIVKKIKDIEPEGPLSKYDRFYNPTSFKKVVNELGLEGIKEKRDIRKIYTTTKPNMDYDTWFKELTKGLVKNIGILAPNTETRDAKGRKKSFAQTHLPITAENVLAAMRRFPNEGRNGYTRTYVGMAAKELNSIQDIKNESERLRTFDKVDEYKMEAEFFKIAEKLKTDNVGYMAMQNDVINAIAKTHEAQGIYDELIKLYPKTMTMEIAKQLEATINHSKELSTDFFEAKPRRIVGFDEIALAVVPKSLSSELKDKLRNAGIHNIKEYEDDNTEERLSVMNEAIDKDNSGRAIRFSVTSKQDDSYMEAVNKGNIEEAQRMVDEAAERKFRKSQVRDENGKLEQMYHGRTRTFNVFSRDFSDVEGDSGKGFYFTNDYDDVSQNYASEDGPDLSNKIARAAERIENEQGVSYEEAKEIAKKQFISAEPNIVTAYLNMTNPARIGKNETFLEYNMEYDEEIEEYGEPSGTLVDFVEALNDNLSEFESYGKMNFWEIFGDRIYDGGIGIGEAIRLIKKEAYDSVTDENGDYAINELIRMSLETIGFDGIIDSSVSTKFKNMGLSEDTTHYIVFDSNQIKSADAVTYDDNGDVIPLSKRIDANSADIRFSVVGKNNVSETKEKVVQDERRGLRFSVIGLSDPVVREALDEYYAEKDYEKGEKERLEKEEDEAFKALYEDEMPLYQGYIDDLRRGRATRLRKIFDHNYEYSEELNPEIEEIHNNYARAIGRTSTYVGDLYGHISRGNGTIYQPNPHEKSVLVGFTIGENNDIFVASHFAPSSIRKGADLILRAANDKMPVIMAVPEYQAGMLEKSGFRYIMDVPQVFAGKIIMKKVMVNDATKTKDLKALADFYMADVENIAYFATSPKNIASEWLSAKAPHFSVVGSRKDDGVRPISFEEQTPMTKKEEQVELTDDPNYNESISKDNNGEPTIDTVEDYIERKNSVIGKFTGEDVAAIQDMLFDSQVEDIASLQKKIGETLMVDGQIKLNKANLKKSGLYKDSEIENILNNELLQNQVSDMLTQIYEYVSDGGIREQTLLNVAVESSEKFKTDEVTATGKYRSINPLYAEAVMREELGGVKDGQEFKEAVQNLSIPEIAESIENNPEYEQSVYMKYSGMQRVPYVNEKRTDSVEFSVRRFTHLDKRGFATTQKQLEDIFDNYDKFTDRTDDMVSLVRKIEETSYKYGVDLYGLTSMYENGTRTTEEIGDFIASYETMLTDMHNYNESYKSWQSLEEFISSYDKLFGRGNKAYVVDNSQRKALYTAENYEENELFEQGYIRVGDKMYQKIQKISVDKLYEGLYEASLISPVMPLAAYKSAYKDGELSRVAMRNKEAVIADMKAYFGGLVTADMTEQKILTYRALDIPVPTKVGESVNQTFDRVVERERYGNKNFDLMKFATDLNDMMIKEKAENSPLYNNVLKYFAFKDDFSPVLKYPDVYTTQQLKATLPEDLREGLYQSYLQTGEQSLSGLFDIVPSEARDRTSEIEYKVYMSNPEALPLFGGVVNRLSDQRVEIPNTYDNFIRLNDGAYYKVAEKTSSSVYETMRDYDQSVQSTDATLELTEETNDEFVDVSEKDNALVTTMVC